MQTADCAGCVRCEQQQPFFCLCFCKWLTIGDVSGRAAADGRTFVRQPLCYLCSVAAQNDESAGQKSSRLESRLGTCDPAQPHLKHVSIVSVFASCRRPARGSLPSGNRWACDIIAHPPPRPTNRERGRHGHVRLPHLPGSSPALVAMVTSTGPASILLWGGGGRGGRKSRRGADLSNNTFPERSAGVCLSFVCAVSTFFPRARISGFSLPFSSRGSSSGERSDICRMASFVTLAVWPSSEPLSARSSHLALTMLLYMVGYQGAWGFPSLSDLWASLLQTPFIVAPLSSFISHSHTSRSPPAVCLISQTMRIQLGQPWLETSSWCGMWGWDVFLVAKCCHF